MSSKSLVVALLVAAALLGTAALRAPSSFHFPLFGDGHYYFLQSHSLFEDGDLDLENQRALFGDPLATHIAVTRGLGNSLLWAPFYALGRLWGTLVSDDVRSVALHAAWGCRAGTLFYLLAALALLFGWSAVTHRSPAWRLVCLGALVVGSPLFGHTFRLPLYNHVLTLFLVAVLLRAGDASALAPRRAAAALGIALGLALTTRPELVVFALPALTQARVLVLHKRRALEALLVTAACAAPPVIAAAWLLSRSTVSVLPPAGFVDLLHPHWLELAFSPRNGWFAQQPLLFLALLGLCFGLVRAPLARRALVLAALLFAWVQASAWDVWGGFGFGARRMIPALPLIYFGLCELPELPRLGAVLGPLLRALTLGWAAFHGYSVLDVERAAAIDRGDVSHESTYEAGVGIATSLPLLAIRALEVDASLKQAYRIAWRSALPTSLARAGKAVDRLATDSERGRDLTLAPGSFALPLQRAPLCGVALPESVPASATLTLDGRRLLSTAQVAGYRAYPLPEPITERWIRFDVRGVPAPTEIVLDGRCGR